MINELERKALLFRAAIQDVYRDDLVSTMMEIDTQPTAYDVKNVIEQIESIKEKKYGACTDEQCGFCDYFNDCWDGEMCDKLALDKAIEIVKGGGVDGN